MINGVKFEFPNGEKLVIPPLALGAMEDTLLEDLLNFDGTVTKQNIATITKATHSALKRNYPDISEEKVRYELLDLGNMLDVMQAVMDVGGLARKAQEQGSKVKKEDGYPGDISKQQDAD